MPQQYHEKKIELHGCLIRLNCLGCFERESSRYRGWAGLLYSLPRYTSIFVSGTTWACRSAAVSTAPGAVLCGSVAVGLLLHNAPHVRKLALLCIPRENCSWEAYANRALLDLSRGP